MQLAAKRSVDLFSSTFHGAGVTAQMTTVRAFPPSGARRMRVSMLSRYGMRLMPLSVPYACTPRFLRPSFETTSPSVTSDLLMISPGSASLPALSASMCSRPTLATSTRYSLPTRALEFRLPPRSADSTVRRKIVCARLSSAPSIARRVRSPSSKMASTSSSSRTIRSAQPFTTAPLVASARITSDSFRASNRSASSSPCTWKKAARTTHSRCAACAAAAVKTSRAARSATPGSDAVPRIVCDLPAPSGP